MKNIQINYLSFLLPLLLFIISCSDTTPEPCDVENRTNQEIQEISNIRFKDLELSIGSQTILVITNQKDYEKHITAEGNLPPIDFSKKVLFAGAVKSPHCIALKGQYLQTGCNKSYYRVEINPLVCQAITTLEFFATADKNLASVDGGVEYIFLKEE